MKTLPRMAPRPDLVSISSALMRRSLSIDDAGGQRMKQNIDLVRQQQIVGRAFIGGGVVGLRLDLAEHQMRRVQAAEPVDARQQFVGDAVHDLFDLAMHIGVQAAEIGDAGGGAHAAEKAVALDQQHAAAMHAGGGRGRDPGRSAAQHHDIVFAASSGFRAPVRSGWKGLDGHSLNFRDAAGGLQWPPPSPLLRRLAGVNSATHKRSVSLWVLSS